MGRKRKQNRVQQYSANELAALGRCERQILFRLRGRREHVSPQLDAARRHGDAEHARRHEVLKRLPAGTGLDRGQQGDRRCFIATAVYGADAWQVHVLRAWRDRSLKTHLLGRALVCAYYGCSPPLAAWLSRHSQAARWVRGLLDRWVERVNTTETRTWPRIGL